MTREEFLKEVDSLTAETQKNVNEAKQSQKNPTKQISKKKLTKQSETKPE